MSERKELLRNRREARKELNRMRGRLSLLNQDLDKSRKELYALYGVTRDRATVADIELSMMLAADYSRITKSHDFMTDLDLEYLTSSLPWAQRWKESSFAKVACGRGFASALMLTDAPEDADVAAPWGAWSLIVPPGTLAMKLSAESLKRGIASMVDNVIDINLLPGDMIHDLPVARILCDGASISGLITGSPSGQYFPMTVSTHGEPDTMGAMARNYVRGVCLSLDSDIEKHRGVDWGRCKTPGNNRSGAPREGVSYVIGKSVAIDLSHEVNRLCLSRGGPRPPSVQFLVRGHWRNQSHGKGRALRRRQWIEPFWKGPEESRVLLRTHVIKNQPGDRP